MTGNAAHPAGGWIVDHAAQKFGAFFFGWCDAVRLTLALSPNGGEGTKARVGHFERAEDFFCDEGVQIGLADAPNDFSQDDEIDVTVAKEGPGWIDRLLRARQIDSRVVARPGRRQWH